jgi:hypothetical protein
MKLHQLDPTEATVMLRPRKVYNYIEVLPSTEIIQKIFNDEG